MSFVLFSYQRNNFTREFRFQYTEKSATSTVLQADTTQHMPMQEVWRLIQHRVVLLHKLTSDTLRTRLHHHRSVDIKHNTELSWHKETI